MKALYFRDLTDREQEEYDFFLPIYKNTDAFERRDLRPDLERLATAFEEARQRLYGEARSRNERPTGAALEDFLRFARRNRPNPLMTRVCAFLLHHDLGYRTRVEDAEEQALRLLPPEAVQRMKDVSSPGRPPLLEFAFPISSLEAAVAQCASLAPRVMLLRRLEDDYQPPGNPAFRESRIDVSPQEVADRAHELLRERPFDRYRLRRRHATRKPNFPTLLLEDLAEELGISPATARRRLIAGGFQLPERYYR